MKKLISIILAFMMLVSLGTSVMGANTFYDEALFDISSLGLYIPDANGSYNTDKPLTRAEVATVILRLTQHDANLVEYGKKFSDVNEDAWYYNAIQTAVSFGYMQGDAEGTFRPDAPVSYQEAVKVLVSVLGYDTEAAKNGGYPAGYITMGARLNITDKVRVNGEFTRGDFAALLYNALDVEILMPVYGSDYFEKDGTTYRYLLMRTKGNKVYNVTGVVTATNFSYIEFPIREMTNDEVVIDNVRCKVGNTNVADYIGMNVEIFAAEDENGIVTILSAKPTRKNNITKVALTDIGVCSSETATYRKEGDKKDQELDFEDLPRMLYNGIPISFDADELMTGNSGEAVFVDNDGKKKIDIVFINTYENALIQRVSNATLIPYDGFTINGERNFFYDEDNEAKKYEFYNKYGEEIEFSDIEPNDMISVYADKGGSRFRVYVSEEMSEGIYSAMDDYEITVGSESYKTYEQTVYGADLGDNVEIYLDYLGYVAYMRETTSDGSYAYVMGIESEKRKEGQIRLLIPKTVSFSADENIEDIDNQTSEPVLICENEGFIVYDLAEYVKVDGRKREIKDAVTEISEGDVIKYKLDSEGKFASAERMSFYAGSDTTRLKYSIYERIFGQNAYVQGFALDEKTKIICLPIGGGSDEDYLVRTRIDKNGNTEGYLVQAYDYNEKTKNAGLIVVTKAMDAEFVGVVNAKSSAACMVTNISTLIDENDERYRRITLIEGGKEVEYLTTTIKSGNTVLNSVKAGDLISYYMNDNDLIDNVKILHSFADGDGEYDINHGEYNEYCGTVTEVTFDEINNAKGIRATRVLCEINGSTKEIMVQQRNKPPVFVYYGTNAGDMEASSLEEISVGHDKVYFMTFTESSGDNIRAVVIVRGN